MIIPLPYIEYSQTKILYNIMKSNKLATATDDLLKGRHSCKKLQKETPKINNHFSHEFMLDR